MQLFKQARAHGLGSLPGNVLRDFMISLPQSGSRAEMEEYAASVGGAKGLLALSHADT